MRQSIMVILGVVCLAVFGSPAMAQSQSDDPNIESVEADDPEMNAAIEEARRTLPEFLTVLEDPNQGVSYISFKFPLSGWEHIWVSNVRRDGDHLTGQLSNVPQQPDWSQGDSVRVPLNTISDWSWMGADGVMRGHYTTRVILKRIEPAHAAQIRSSMGWDQ